MGKSHRFGRYRRWNRTPACGHAAGGIDGLRTMVRRVIDEVRIAALLSGCRSMNDLRSVPLVIDPRLQRWIPAESPLAQRVLR